MYAIRLASSAGSAGPEMHMHLEISEIFGFYLDLFLQNTRGVFNFLFICFLHE